MQEKRRVGSRRLAQCAVAFVAGTLLLGCATAPAGPAEPANAVTSSGTWTFAFDAGPGIASATLSAGTDPPSLRVTCKAPNGPVTIQDWTFVRTRQSSHPATFAVGGRSGLYTATVSGDGAGRQALVFQVAPRDPVFADLTPSAAVTTTAAGFTHTWAPGAASRLNDVINACHPMGS